MKKEFIIASLCLLFSCAGAYAQQDDIKLAKAEAEANKSKTGQNQDVLTNYLQIIAKNFTSSDKGVQLKLNWFALNGMDSVHKYQFENYKNSRWQRNGQFSLSGGMDDNGKMNSVSGGASYNILNKRDTAFANYHDFYQGAMRDITAITKTVRLSHLPALKAQVRAKIQAITADLISKGSQTSDLTTIILQEFKNYTIVDKQDSQVILLVQTDLNNDIQSKSVSHAQLSQRIDVLAGLIAQKTYNDPINAYVSSDGKKEPVYDNYITKELFDTVISEINSAIKTDAGLTALKLNRATDINDFYTKLTQRYRNAIEYVARQPLATIGYEGTHGWGSALSSHVFTFQYLQGLSKLGSGKSTELTITVSDTLSGSDPTGMIRTLNRNLITTQGGINFVLAKSKKVSVMELNIGVEDDIVTQSKATGEKWNTFMFNSYFRVRLPETPWLKFNLKYDPKDHNVLGFLNFTYNLDK